MAKSGQELPRIGKRSQIVKRGQEGKERKSPRIEYELSQSGFLGLSGISRRRNAFSRFAAESAKRGSCFFAMGNGQIHRAWTGSRYGRIFPYGRDCS